MSSNFKEYQKPVIHYEDYNRWIPTIKKGLTYDDVAIIPRPFSRVESRRDIDLRAKFSKNIYIQKPFVSSPMDTITGVKMCRTMCKFGGIGVLHRFYSLDEYKKLLKEHEWCDYTGNNIECVSIGVTGDYLERFEIASKSYVKAIIIDIANGASIKMKEALKTLNEYRQSHKKQIDIIVGNIATGDQAREIMSWGYEFEGIRALISGGSACSTFRETKVYVPLVTAIQEVRQAIEESDNYKDVSLIADGGIKMAGHVAIAIGAGADCVMLGGILAGTDETPTELITKRNWLTPWKTSKYKMFRGSASFSSKADRGDSPKHIEGVESLVPYKGSVDKVLNNLEDGLRSSMSYCDSLTINEFHAKCKFIEITNNGVLQGMPHITK
jgi:IMP dehydrogenase